MTWAGDIVGHMGSYDRAEICELVGHLILVSLEQRFCKNVGL